MKEYFMGIISVVFLGATMISLSPKGYEKHLRLLCGFCSVAVILFPLFSLVGNEGNPFDGLASLFSQEEYQEEYYEKIYNNSLLISEKKNAEKMLKNDMLQEISANNDSFDVNIVVEQNNDEFYISSIEVLIYPSGVDIDPRSIEKYVKEALGCECRIIYDF